MRIFTKRNAVIGWGVLQLVQRKIRGRVDVAAERRRKRRRRVLAGAGVAAFAAATAVGTHYARRALHGSAHAVT